MEEFELKLFNIISNVGTARSNFIEAIRASRKGNVKEAEELMAEGKKAYSMGHEVHMELLQMEGTENAAKPTLLLIHAEDLMMSAETFSILSEEFIALQKDMSAINKSLQKEV